MRQALNLSSWLISNADIVAHHAPATVPRLRVWLRAIRAASESKDRDFVSWVAKHWDSLGHWRDADAVVRDLGDWVKASRAECVLASLDELSLQRVRDAVEMSGADELAYDLQRWSDSKTAAVVGRPFSDRMARRTVLRLSEEWHTRAAQTQAISVPFPTPWYTGGEAGEFCIAPITDAIELTRYAFALHNCASQYAREIAADCCFLYVVLHEDKPGAMLELVRANGVPRIRQLVGLCNAKVDKAVGKAAKTWLRQRRKAEGNGRIAQPIQENPLGDDVPF